MGHALLGHAVALADRHALVLQALESTVMQYGVPISSWRR